MTTQYFKPQSFEGYPGRDVPAVMAFSGCDPCGGAGIQADIETLASMGCHTTPIITCQTIQNTRTVLKVEAVATDFLLEQATTVLDDINISAFKIGLLPNTEIVHAICQLITAFPAVPVVLDPVLSSGNGNPLVDRNTLNEMISVLLPLTTVLTPNSLEARAMCPNNKTLDECGDWLAEQGAEAVLITGSHEETEEVTHSLYIKGQNNQNGKYHAKKTYTWQRLPGHFHGSGCTLASAISGLLAQGLEPVKAIVQAQEYTWESLKHGYPIGLGQAVPNRLYWTREHAPND